MIKEITYTIVNQQGLPLAYPSVSSSDKPAGFFVLNEGKEKFQRNTLGEIRKVGKENAKALNKGCFILKEETIKIKKSFPIK